MNLQDAIIAATGCDPVNDPAFAYATDMPCDRCGQGGPTALLTDDDAGQVEQRVCVNCANW